MREPENAVREPLKRFAIVATEYGMPSRGLQCNSNKVWQSYLRNHFSTRLKMSEIDFEKTISNASFRISGLELKIGILLSDDESSKIGNHLLTKSTRPSIVMDCVLAVFSVLEGLSMLSYFCSVDEIRRRDEINKEKRGDKLTKGLRFAMNTNVTQEVSTLRKLRDRCMHQDHADRQDGVDYSYVFGANSIRPQVGLIFNYLKTLENTNNKMPNTNLDEFWHFDSPI